MSVGQSGPRRLTVLAVCTGNICRSPAVERLLGGWLGAAGLDVSSAGTAAVVGAPMSEPMAALVTAAGGRTDGFRARQLTERMAAEADLVLTATGDHRRAVVQLCPSALRTTFTLRELARLGEVVRDELPAAPAVDRLRALVPAARLARGTHRAGRGEDDIEDPYGRSESAYRRSFGQLLPAVHTLLDLAVGTR